MASNSSLAVWVLGGRGLAATAALEPAHPPMARLSSRVSCRTGRRHRYSLLLRDRLERRTLRRQKPGCRPLLNRILLNIDPRHFFVV
jgi:hypothetical protein